MNSTSVEQPKSYVGPAPPDVARQRLYSKYLIAVGPSISKAGKDEISVSFNC